MRSVLVHGSAAAEELGSVLEAAGVETRSTGAYAFGPLNVLFFVGRKVVFGARSSEGIVLIAASDGRTQRIDIAYAGGEIGLFGPESGPGEDLEVEVYTKLITRLSQRGLTGESV